MSHGKQVKMITVQLRKKCAGSTWCMGIFNWTLGSSRMLSTFVTGEHIRPPHNSELSSWWGLHFLPMLALGFPKKLMKRMHVRLIEDSTLLTLQTSSNTFG